MKIIYHFLIQCLILSNPRSFSLPSKCIPNLVNKIHKRQKYEKTISIEYLSRLNERYEAWITNYDNGKLLKINVDDMDFVENKSDYESILSMIKKEL